MINLIYNPTRKRSTLLNLLNILNSFDEYNINKSIYNTLINKGYLILIPIGLDTKLSITPEGIIYLYKQNHTSQEIERIQKIIYDEYRKNSFHKINKFYKKETLKKKHISILLFLLLNGSVDETTAYKVKDVNDKRYVEIIINSFINKQLNNITKLYAFNYYLVEAKRILGDVIYNKNSKYYVKYKSIEYVINSIKRDMVNVDVHIQDWYELKKTYQNYISILKNNNNSFYKKSFELELERKLFSVNFDRRDDL